MKKILVVVAAEKSVAIKFAFLAKQLVDARGSDGRVEFEGFIFQITKSGNEVTASISWNGVEVFKGVCTDVSWSPDLSHWQLQMAQDFTEGKNKPTWKTQLRNLTGTWRARASQLDYQAQTHAAAIRKQAERQRQEEQARIRRQEVEQERQMQQTQLVDTLSQLGVTVNPRSHQKGAS